MMIVENKYLKLGETYLKFDFEYNESNVQLIKEIILGHVSENLQFKSLNRNDFKISIEFEKGSLKTRIKFWGTLFTIYIAIGQYGSFRAGMRDMEKGFLNISENIIERVEQSPNINHENILNSQKRTGLPSKIKDILNRLNYLHRNTHDLSANEIQEEILALKQEISNILAILEFEGQQQFLIELPDELSENLPAPINKKVNFYMTKYALKPEDNIDFLDE